METNNNLDTSNVSITIGDSDITSNASTISNDNSAIGNVSISTNKSVSFNDSVEYNHIDIINLSDSTTSNSSTEDIEEESISRLQCKKCNKKFKTKNACSNHIRMQVCLSSKDKTYCSVCDMTFKMNNELDDHLLSEDHYNCINNLTITPINKKTKDIYKLDPILNKNDIKNMNTIDIGTNITFIYNNDSIRKQEITINNDINTDEHTTTNTTLESNQYIDNIDIGTKSNQH